jgi:pyrroline-5-carboxylate reductase
MKKTIGFLGAGKMAEGIVQAVAAARTHKLSNIVMAEKFLPRAEEMRERYGVKTTDDVKVAARKADVLFLSVKPQDVATVAAEIKPLLTEDKLVVSIVAGKSLATLRKLFGAKARLVRVMPNLALRAGEGMCAICAARSATAEDVKLVSSILDAAGRTEVLKERHFDAVTALSGSGPAFFAYMEEAMMEGGVKLGLPRTVARRLAEQTMLGTAAYLRQSGADLGAFIAGVATKGGTTAAGMEKMRDSDFKEIVAATLKAAAARSAELGK